MREATAGCLAGNACRGILPTAKEAATTMATKEILLKLRTQSGLTQEMLAARAGADLFGENPPAAQTLEEN